LFYVSSGPRGCWWSDEEQIKEVGGGESRKRRAINVDLRDISQQCHRPHPFSFGLENMAGSANAAPEMTYQPDLYEVINHSSLQGDVEWYCQRAQESGGAVLELGAGTGRVTIPIATAGVPIHALDSNESMLNALRSKLAAQSPEVRERVTIVQGDMRTFELAERFPLIICPFRAFLHNTSEADQLACLTRVRQHLKPGGRFVFNVFHPSLTFMAQHVGQLAGVWRWGGTHDLPSGGWLIVSEANRYNTVAQRLHGLQRYEVYGPDGVLDRTSMLRLELAYLFPADIRRLLKAAGFTEVSIKGGFDGREFTQEGQELVIEAA
jgi:ubiquinone/menaquinone biosynthesis C-methylase UbiE